MPERGYEMKEYEVAELELISLDNNVIVTSGECNPHVESKIDETGEIPNYCTDGLFP